MLIAFAQQQLLSDNACVLRLCNHASRLYLVIVIKVLEKDVTLKHYLQYPALIS
jgi:hypothetical protein